MPCRHGVANQCQTLVHKSYCVVIVGEDSDSVNAQG